MSHRQRLQKLRRQKRKNKIKQYFAIHRKFYNDLLNSQEELELEFSIKNLWNMYQE